MSRSNRRARLARHTLSLGALIAAVVVISTTVSSAQIGIFPTPTPRPPTPTPEELTPPPTATRSPTPAPPVSVLPGKTDKPKESGTPKPSGTGDPLDGDLDNLPDALEEELVIPSFPRTRPRNTVELVNTLRELTDLGIPLEQVLVDGMGRFPVAGLAHYFDDWLNPRFTPKPHLHKGLDIFADFGTPIRAPDNGVVTSLPSHGAGGIAVWMRGSDGTSYYLAHMLERAEGIGVGTRVETGTVLGFVGDTGNASGGTPHMHFQIHPGGGAPVPPKPTVDGWLDEALELAPRFVEARRADVDAKGRIIGSATGGQKTDELDASMMLTLLDPVGGSVGMLPSLEVRPRGRSGGAVSDRLLGELIRNRVSGYLFVPSQRASLGD